MTQSGRAKCTLLNLLVLLALGAGAQGTHDASSVKSALSDLVIVIPTSTGRHKLVNATRSLRHGARTYIVTNDSEIASSRSGFWEAYGYYGDDSKENKTWRGRQAGEGHAWAMPSSPPSTTPHVDCTHTHAHTQNSSHTPFGSFLVLPAYACRQYALGICTLPCPCPLPRQWLQVAAARR